VAVARNAVGQLIWWRAVSGAAVARSKWLDAVRHKAADAAVSQTDDPERSQNPSRPFSKFALSGLIVKHKIGISPICRS